MESVFSQNPYEVYLLMVFAGFAAIAAIGTLACWFAGFANPKGEQI